RLLRVHLLSLRVPSVLVFVFFCFSCSPDRRLLHSFPTRRSSDLPDREQLDLTFALARRWRNAIRSRLHDAHAARRDAVVEPGTEDRKSTRLNSSHQINSYAVFCLKKKTHDAPFMADSLWHVLTDT